MSTPCESSTLLRALSSSSMFSFLRWSSVNVRCAEPPLAALAVVGPEGMVGAWRLFMLSGRPIAVRWRSISVPFSWREGGGDDRGV